MTRTPNDSRADATNAHAEGPASKGHRSPVIGLVALGATQVRSSVDAYTLEVVGAAVIWLGTAADSKTRQVHSGCMPAAREADRTGGDGVDLVAHRRGRADTNAVDGGNLRGQHHEWKKPMQRRQTLKRSFWPNEKPGVRRNRSRLPVDPETHTEKRGMRATVTQDRLSAARGTQRLTR